MIACQDCKHCEWREHGAFCKKYVNVSPDFIYGNVSVSSPCVNTREDATKCGAEARGFEARVSWLKQVFSK